MRVLILSVPAGGGHMQTAKALNEYLSKQENTECEILDIAENVNDLAVTLLSEGYILTSTYMQTGYRFVYNQMDKRTKKSFTPSSQMLYQIYGKQLIEYISNFKPDIIVSTHVFATVVLNIHAKKHKFGAKIVSIVTDFTVHPIWEQTSSDYYIIASENLTLEALKKLGTADNVLPLGIPIKEEFSKKMSSKDAKTLLGLKDKFTVLIMMGSMGYTDASIDIVKQLDKLDDDLQIVVVCGKNTTLKKKLSRKKTTKDMIVHGFCDNIPVLMDACDCIITKPGGLTTSEAMAKNIPIILVNPIPGQEERNMEFLQNNGVAMSLSAEFTADKAVYQLIRNADIKEHLIDNIKRLAKPNSTRNLVEFLQKISK